MRHASLPLLSNVHVASPCPASWAKMKGDARVRHCSLCNLNVYDLSELTADEAERLLESHEGRLCVRYYQRRDGTVITRNCPVGVWRARRALARIGAFTGACVVFLLAGVGRLVAATGGWFDISWMTPIQQVYAAFAPPRCVGGIVSTMPPGPLMGSPAPVLTSNEQEAWDQVE